PTNQLSLLQPGESLTIGAASSLEADFTLSINGTIVDTALGTMTYNYTHVNIVENAQYVLEATAGGESRSETFMVVVAVEEQAVPAGMLDGINLDPGDPGKATKIGRAHV